MLKMKERERANSWPSFVDVFSNLVIILIFLLIVFVFLWTTTNIFHKGGGLSQLSELKKVSLEQSEKIAELEERGEEAEALLLAARDELLSLDSKRAESDALIEQLRADKEQDQETVRRAASLQAEIERMNAALSDAEQKRRDTEVEYAAMSERLNKALADKVSELTQLSKYQSQFFGAVRDALSGMGGVDVSGDRFVISSDILFPLGGFGLSHEGKKQLKLIADIIKGMEKRIPADVKWVIRVDGHTDRIPVNRDATMYRNNLELSLLRAREVVKELEARGVSKSRLIPAGFGETAPVVKGKTAKELQKNRRIELRLTNP